MTGLIMDVARKTSNNSKKRLSFIKHMCDVDHARQLRNSDIKFQVPFEQSKYAENLFRKEGSLVTFYVPSEPFYRAILGRS